jgi:hypothetical protein
MKKKTFAERPDSNGNHHPITSGVLTN